METIIQEADVFLCCIKATSFPAGVMDAHKKIHELVPAKEGRRYFGISRPEKGSIVYQAAAEIRPDEAHELKCESTVTLPGGRYISHTIKDFMKDVPAIGKTFQEMLATPGIDPNGYCVEWYLNDTDVQCMIRLAS